MSHNYIIAIGGTGARCLESYIYLMSAGITKDPTHVLLLDSENTNGNGRRTEELVQNYDSFFQLKQPERPVAAGFLRTAMLPPTIFQAELNRNKTTGEGQDPVRWVNQNDINLKFSEVIEYSTQPAEVRQFIDLFYSADDLDMSLKDGYRARPNIGSVAFKQALENTVKAGNPLHIFLQRLNTDLQAGEARLFVFGSVFGGTGAAGLPIIPALIKELPSDGVIAEDNRSRIRFGCAMMKPYFSFPREGSDDSQMLDSSKHDVATQAALLHYSQSAPGYQHMYLIGSPSKVQTNEMNVASGSDQQNRAHYVEVAAALAAWDFFNIDRISADDKKLHYADTLDGGTDIGVTWETLPMSPVKAHLRKEIMQKWVIFTTFAYFYQKLLHTDFINNQKYKTAYWYKHNFSTLPLDTETTALASINTFVSSYLAWLNQVGVSFTGPHQMFSWNAIDGSNTSLQASEFLSSLMNIGEQKVRYNSDSRDTILMKMDGIRIRQPDTTSAAGLFVYILYEAVAEFCRENYNWK